MVCEVAGDRMRVPAVGRRVVGRAGTLVNWARTLPFAPLPLWHEKHRDAIGDCAVCSSMLPCAAWVVWQAAHVSEVIGSSCAGCEASGDIVLAAVPVVTRSPTSAPPVEVVVDAVPVTPPPAASG